MDASRRQLPARAVLILSSLLAPPAYAYLDPGSGSFLLQLLLGGLAGIGVAFSMFWHRILVFLHLREDDVEDGNDGAR